MVGTPNKEEKHADIVGVDYTTQEDETELGKIILPADSMLLETQGRIMGIEKSFTETTSTQFLDSIYNMKSKICKIITVVTQRFCFRGELVTW